MEEQWKPVEGYEGSYEVSDHGRVRSKRGRFVGHSTGDGYRSVALSRDGSCRPFRIHRLVARAFIGSIPHKYVVHHIDGDRANNHVDNLAILSNQENVCRHVAGRVISIPILTEDDVRMIRSYKGPFNCWQQGRYLRGMAARLGVNLQTVRKVFFWQSWQHVK